MRNNYLSFLFVLLIALSDSASAQQREKKDVITASIDLVNVVSDKVKVEVLTPTIKSQTTTFRFARIIPGTYAIADYGRYVDSVEAFDKKGRKLNVNRVNPNEVAISGASSLSRITYWVNDTYDIEQGGDVFSSKDNQIFSPAGTNILAGKQFMLNLAGFLGFFDELRNAPYTLKINKPASLYGTTALVDEDPSEQRDVFRCSNFAEAVDNPIMYAEADTAGFTVNGMNVVLGVYAPHKNVDARRLLPDVEKTIRAQKKFLGPLNTTKKYAVIVYLTDMGDKDPKGIGALEHNNSTTAVFRTSVNANDLIHVIGHEFFHTVTPLKIHSEQIQNFDFSDPKLSRHLWFYEGATEYFASLYQIQQGLITEDEFYNLIASKIESAKGYNDTLSMTRMSANVIDPKMKPEYPNVYMKGALLNMCLDIIIREESAGKKGLIDLLAELAKSYGPQRAFPDTDFINIVGKMAGAKVASFLHDHVENGKPVDYAGYLSKVGLKPMVVKVPEPMVFISHDEYYLDIDVDSKQVLARLPDANNVFMNNLGFKDGDVLLKMNGVPMYEEEPMLVMLKGYELQEGAPVSFDILRGGKPMSIKGTVKLNYIDGDGFRPIDDSLKALREAWLKAQI